MKNILAPILISFLLLSISGSLATMNHMGNQGHTRCPFEVAGVVDCNQIQNSLSFVISHLNAISGFFLAIPTTALASLFVLLSLLILISIYLRPDRDLRLLKPQLLHRTDREREFFILPHQEQLMHWLSLHENSPAFVERR